MNPFRTLRTWLGQPSTGNRSASARRRDLRIELLEDRLTPAISDKILGQPTVLANLPTTQDLLALTSSPHPLQDLQNLVDHLHLGGLIDVNASAVAITNASSTLLQIHLTPAAQARSVAVTLFDTGLYSFVSPNYIYPQSATGRNLLEQVPNDPQYPAQYQNRIIGTPTAWDSSTGSNVLIALLDDGVDILHPDLVGTTFTNTGEIAGDNIDNDNNGYIDDVHGWDFLSNSNRVTPDDAAIDVHGTQVAGLLAASFNNATGIAGVAGSARFLPLKVVGNGATTSLTIARAVNYAIERGAKIINNSINIDGFSEDPVFRAAVTSAYDHGLLWINSAGNLNLKDPPRTGIDEILVVSATDANDVKTTYSNYGYGVDISAPGGTADNPLTTTLPGGLYGTAFGSSMAAPLVAGTAALIWGAHPEYTRDQVASALLANADSLDALNPAYLDLLGTGRVNTAKAVSSTPFATKLGRLYDMPGPGQDAPAGFNHFSLRLLGNLDGSTITSPNFELRGAGADNIFDNSDDVTVSLNLDNAADYKLGTNSLEFTLSSSLSRGLYRFTAFSGGLRDPFNTPVDGDANGTAGGNLVRYFGNPLQIRGQIVWDPDGPMGTSPAVYVPGSGAFADANGNGHFDTTTFNSPTAPVNIIDNDGTNPAAYDVAVSGFTAPVSYLTVSVLLSHPAPADLVITLISPSGQSVTLLRNRFLPASVPADSRLFEFADDITEEIDASTGLVTYRLRPDQALSSFYGSQANGVWRVVVADTTPGDSGLLISASLTIGQEVLALADSSGEYGFSGLPEIDTIDIVPYIPDGWRLKPGSSTGFTLDWLKINTSTPQFDLIPAMGISGRVIDDVTGEGVAGATVVIDGTGNSVTTDDHGNFLFPDLTGGSYTVRLVVLPGYSGSTPRTVTLAFATPLSTGNDFHVSRDTAPVEVILTPVTPTVRTTEVDSISFDLSEPLTDLKLSDIHLTRDNAIINLSGATLIGNGTRYTLIGLGNLTDDDGIYTLSIFAPAPVGDPDREPMPVLTSWTLDTTPPTATVTPVVGPKGIVDQLTIVFSSPVNGVDLTDFTLKRGGVTISLSGASLTPLGPNAFTIGNLAAIASTPGDYQLTVNGPGVTDAAGNAMTTPAVANWTIVVRPVKYTAVGAGEGSLPTVVIYDTDGHVVRSLTPFDTAFTGGVRVAVGDVNGDGTDDIIVSMGRGAAPRVKVYDGKTFAVLNDFLAFEPKFTGGVLVAAGDITGDGKAEIIVTPDKGGGPRVRVLNALTAATVADFFGIQDVNFRGGARASIGDVTGDGRLDVVVAAGTGGGPRIAVFDGVSVAANNPSKPFGDFLAFESNLRNGANITVADIDGDGHGDIIAGAGDGGGPRLTAFSGSDLMTNQYRKLTDFFVGNIDTRGGLRLSVKDLDDDGVSELLVGPGSGTGSRIRVYSAHNLTSQLNPATLREFDPFGGFLGGVFLG
ncbi:hypothetical protein BH11PLA2_BH11PLA2_24850 [soil metagenome]